ncbi:alpha/beta fold hydrolase [Nakamurella alba]|uniref:alpha/beta fold hydrolase n=1 Tax=Nakamurella alba TaxID=2665158 RepID=UPI0018ABEECA|nr:alpha/beta hydrolase [Nakamurella alba]
MSESEQFPVHSDDGTTIAVRVTRPAEVGAPRPPVLLVHGFGSGGAANWERTGWLRTLGRAGITAIAVDLRGHGGSDRPHDPARYRLDTLLADLRAVAAALPELAGPVDLVGYSLGGRLVCELAHRPGRLAVRRMVIGGYAGTPLLQDLPPDAVDQAFAQIGGPPAVGEQHRGATRLAAIAAATPSNDLTALRALVAGLSVDPALARAAPPPQQPTLVVTGALDPIDDAAQAWAASLPHARWLEVPGRDHISVVTAALFRERVAEFLTDPRTPAR